MNYFALLRTFGPYVVILILLASCGVEGKRLEHAKTDLKAAREANIDTATGKTWRSEAELAALNLATCKANATELRAAIDLQNSSLETAGRLVAERDAEIARGRAATAQASRRAQSVADELSAFRQKGADECAKLLDVDREVLRLNR